MNYARPIVLGIFLGFGLLLVGSQNEKERFSVDMQVYKNTARLDSLERQMHDMEVWREDHVNHATSEGMQRIATLEVTINRVERAIWGMAFLVVASVVTAVLRLVLKRRNGNSR